MAYDAARRLLFVVNDTGSCGVCAVYRDEQVTAWSRIGIPDTAITDVCCVGADVYFLANFSGTYFILLLDDALCVDLGLAKISGSPTTTWSGFGHLEGRDVAVVAGGADVGLLTVSGGVITTPSAVTTMQAGMPFTHTIAPLPPAAQPGMQAHAGKRIRPVRVTFQVDQTSALDVDAGLGLTGAGFSLAIASQGAALPFTGEVEIGCVGWKSQRTPLWRVSDATPLPCTVLAVETEFVINE